MIRASLQAVSWLQTAVIFNMKEKEEIRKSIIKILEKNNLLTLSTINKNKPHSCSAYYVFDKELNLYIWTEKKSKHSTNILKNPKVSINIADTSQKWGSNLQGIQMQGIAKETVESELIKAGTLYMKRFPGVLKHVKKAKDFISKEFESVILKFEISKIKLLDEETFGKEEYREVKLK